MTSAPFSEYDIHHPVLAREGLVTSQEAHATRVGVEILRRGGNAVDAAIAVGYALAVTLPRAGNIAGGGNLMVHMPAAGSDGVQTLDYREQAPAAAHATMFQGPDGQIEAQRAWNTHEGVAVPGTVRAFEELHARHGSLPLAELIAPAVKLAREGFVVWPELSWHLGRYAGLLRRNAAARAIFLRPDGQPWAAGERLIQRDLADSLEAIAAGGAAVFHGGTLGEAIAADMRKHGGHVTAADLAAFKAVWRDPLRGSYRGNEVLSIPPSSSGGLCLLLMLNMLEGFDVAGLGAQTGAGLHLLAEVMRRAYAERSDQLGDPEFWDNPVERFLSKAVAEELARGIDPERATRSLSLKEAPGYVEPDSDTTSYTVVDRHGNCVVNTYSLNANYGSGIVAEGTGILLNNCMHNFPFKIGDVSVRGLLGSPATEIAPGKRPLSNITPAMVFRDGGLVLATGTPGGARIITSILQVIVNVLDHGMNVAAATHAPRMHQQWLPDLLELEAGINPDAARALEARGHRVRTVEAMCAVKSIARNPEGWAGAADPRRPSGLALGV